MPTKAQIITTGTKTPATIPPALRKLENHIKLLSQYTII